MKPGVDYIGVSAGAMILNEKGQVFLAKRSQNAKNERGFWETPGGAVEYGETLEEAMRREIREEYGVEVKIVEQYPAADHIIPEDKQHWVATTFLVTLKKGVPKILEPRKCDQIGWFDLTKLPSPLSLITQHDLRYFKRLGKRV
jgi:mutator protein MutT